MKSGAISASSAPRRCSPSSATAAMPRVGVDHDRPPERVGHRAEVELLADEQRVAVAHRHADVVAAETFGLQLPTERVGQRVGLDEHAAVDDVGRRPRVVSSLTIVICIGEARSACLVAICRWIASEFLGLRATHNPLRWYLDVVPGICTDDQFLFGGCGLGAAIAALERTTGRPAVWATAQYLSFAHPPEIVDIDVTVAVAGHQTTQARAVAHVGDREILTVNAALGARDGGYDGQWARFPDVPRPDDCPPRQRISRVDDSLAQRLEMRLARGRDLAALDGGPDDGHSALWARVPDGPRDVGGVARHPRRLRALRHRPGAGPVRRRQQPRQHAAGVHARAHRVGAPRHPRPRHRPRLRPRSCAPVGRGRHAARHREPVVRRAATHARRSD